MSNAVTLGSTSQASVAAAVSVPTMSGWVLLLIAILAAIAIKLL
jgi:hypothetical protein